MKKVLLLSLSIIFAGFGAMAQKAKIDLPINWDDTANVDYTVVDFGGNISSLAADPSNSSNLVMKSDKPSGSQTWAGTTLSTTAGLANKVPFAAGSTVIKALVYSPDSGITVKLKVEDASDASKSVETDVITSKANSWDTLTFDFTMQSTGTAAINYTYTYDKMSIFYDFGSTGPTTGSKSYYVDSIWFVGSSAPSKAQIDLPINWDDTANVDYTVSDFGGNISALAADPVNSSNMVMKSDKPSGSQTWAGTTLSTSAGLANKVPFAVGSTVIKALVYSPDSGITVKLKVEDATDATKSVETDVMTTKANSWDTLSFDFTNHSSGTAAINYAQTYDKMSIFYDFGSTGPATGSKSYYVDSIWFMASPPPPAKAQIELPITWDDTANVDYTVTDFGGNASALAADPTNSSNMVMRSEKTSGAQTWAGTTLSTNAGLAKAIPFAAGATIIKVVVYSPDSGTVVRLKAEDKTDAAKFVETDMTTSVANAWDTLTYDFANVTPALNFSTTYDKLSIFYDFGNMGSGKVYYVDWVAFNPGASGQSKAQIDLPITWDDTANVDYTVTDFGGNSSMMAADPMNASNMVMMSEKTASAQTWAGTTLSTSNGLKTAIPFAPGKTKMMAVVYSPDSGITVKLKVEDHTDGTKSVETDVMTTVANAWDTLTFDFTNHSSGTSPINFANTYDMASIFYNFGVDGATAGSKTYYVDYVAFDTTGGTPPPPAKAQIDLPITWDDTANVDYSVTDFGGNSSMMAADPNNATNLVMMSEKTTSAQTWAGTTLSTPLGLKNKIPFKSNETVIKAVVYSPDVGTPVRLKVEDATDGTISVETEVNTTVANAWDTLSFDFNIPVSGTPQLDTSKTYDKVSIFYNFGTDGATAGSKTYYVDDVFFGGAGSPPPPKPDTVMVTFRVDMNEHSGGFTTPEVNGTFNNWCGSCNAMADTNSDGIWETTIALWQDEIEWKYSYDNWGGQEDLDSNLTCILKTGQFINRFMKLTKDTIMPAVCWESCVECQSSSVEEKESQKVITLFPNPSESVITLSGFDHADRITVLDLQGRVMAVQRDVTVETTFELHEYESGVYLVRIEDPAYGSKTLRFVKR